MLSSGGSILGLFACTPAAEEGPARRRARQEEKETCRQEQRFLKLSELLFSISGVGLHGKGDSLQGEDAGLACERGMDTPGTKRGSTRSRQWHGIS